ncbi:FtsQ-type POTRA domain-containing protein [bacterium]|nr:FtsQ-type POTRA domain-containing protein [bacterium]
MTDENRENKNNISISQQSENNDEMKRAQKLKRERRVLKGRLKIERTRGFLRFLITACIIVLVILISKFDGLYLNKNAFKYIDPSTVEITNNKIVPTSKIYAVLKSVDVPKGCIFFVKTNNIKKKLYLLKPVDKIYIRRYAFPARIQIIVRESIPTITVTNDIKEKPVAYFTTSGKIVGKEYLPLREDIKTITVVTKGGSYAKWDKETQQRLIKIAKYVETYSKEPVEYLDYRNPEDVYVKIKDINIRLGIPDDSVWLKIERLPSILPQLKYVHSKIRYLDLSWEKVNYLKLD